MDRRSRRQAGPPGTRRVRISPTSALMLATAFGLVAGFIDVAIIAFKKLFLNPEGFYRIARDFPWSVPSGHVVLMMIPGLLGALTCGFLPRRTLLWALATLAAWGALLRLPIYGVCSLLVAAGLGRLAVDWLDARDLSPRRLLIPVSALIGVLALLAAGSTGRQMLRERGAVAALPSLPPHPRNIILLVWDTVRAYSLSVHAAPRDSTPNLRRWSRRGVEYNMALAPPHGRSPRIAASSPVAGRWHSIPSGR